MIEEFFWGSYVISVVNGPTRSDFQAGPIEVAPSQTKPIEIAAGRWDRIDKKISFLGNFMLHDRKLNLENLFFVERVSP